MAYLQPRGLSVAISQGDLAQQDIAYLANTAKEITNEASKSVIQSCTT